MDFIFIFIYRVIIEVSNYIWWKTKYIVINELKEFLNKQIEIYYEGDIGQGMLIKKWI